VSDDELYRVNIQHTASPDEVKAFCDMLEENNYGVATDLSNGSLKIYNGGDWS
jgi:hypothetical protein